MRHRPHVTHVSQTSIIMQRRDDEMTFVEPMKSADAFILTTDLLIVLLWLPYSSSAHGKFYPLAGIRDRGKKSRVDDQLIFSAAHQCSFWLYSRTSLSQTICSRSNTLYVPPEISIPSVPEAACIYR